MSTVFYDFTVISKNLDHNDFLQYTEEEISRVVAKAVEIQTSVINTSIDGIAMNYLTAETAGNLLQVMVIVLWEFDPHRLDN